MNSVNVNQVRALSNKKSLGSTLLTCILVGITLAVIVGMEVYTSMKQGNLVEILTFNCDVQKDVQITEDMFEKTVMPLSEYEKYGVVEVGGESRRQIVLWDDRSRILEQPIYSQYFMHSHTPVTWFSVSPKRSIKNSYLYSMEGELLKLDISGEEFGDFIVPGDRITVRTVYQEPSYYLPTFQEFSSSNGKTGVNGDNKAVSTSVTKVEEVFNNAVILDMLNGDGASIYDIWYKWLDQPVDVQEAALKDDTFKSLTKPSTILMSLPAEEIEAYMLSKQKGGSYTITLMPRENSNVIINALDSLNYDYQ